MKYLYLGKIVNTHGLKGEMRLISHFKYKNKIFVPNNNIYIGNNKTKEIINSYRIHKQFDMITLKGYISINEILKYKGEKVYILKEELKLGNNEYLNEDIIGLTAIIDNINIGKVTSIISNFKQEILVIQGEKEYLIPYVSDIIEEINLAKQKIVIKNIKGLI